MTSILEPQYWIEKYADLMLNFALRRISNRNLAEDLVQDTFLAALKAKENFKGNSHEKTWLFTILENKITDYYRSQEYKFQKQKINIEAEFGAHFFEEDGHWRNEVSPKSWQNIANETTDTLEEMSRALQDCLKKLPGKLEQLFFLKHVGGSDSKAICKELDITSSNYWVMIHRAKILLRACVETNIIGKA